ncbi:MAG: hypothetical protein ACE5GH_04485 [Fidelibacterota bacterium]
MYKLYLLAHFLLMFLWIVPALISDYRFLAHFRGAGTEKRISILKSIQSVSDRTEMVASFFIPLVGVLMIIERTFWLTEGVMYAKILMALVAIGCYHVARGKLKKMIAALHSGSPVGRLAKHYLAFRSTMLLLLVTVVWTIVSFKGALSAPYLIRSWFG